MKSVYIIGDSISLFYHPFLKEMLKNKAMYYRKGDEKEIQVALHDPNNPFGANGGDSQQVLEYMKQLLEQKQIYDIVLINCGLHDIRTERNPRKKQIDEKEYEKNINQIIEIGKKIANKVIWITTTHVDDQIHNAREGGYLRYNKDVIQYNQIAGNVIKQNNIECIDLYDYTKTLENKQMYRDHIHFKDEISKKQAHFIYQYIDKYL